MASEEPEKATTTEEDLPVAGRRMTYRDSFLGEQGKYDYGALCMPNIPFCGKPNQQVNFYGRGKSLHEHMLYNVLH